VRYSGVQPKNPHERSEEKVNARKGIVYKEESRYNKERDFGYSCAFFAGKEHGICRAEKH
jgi:hypothetical protein